MNRALLGIGIMVVGLGGATVAALLKAHDAWGHELRETLLSAEAADNPGHLILNPHALEEGRREYLPTPPPTSVSQVQATWKHDPAEIIWQTYNTPSEDGEAFAERAGRDFTAMLRVFPKR